MLSTFPYWIFLIFKYTTVSNLIRPDKQLVLLEISFHKEN